MSLSERDVTTLLLQLARFGTEVTQAMRRVLDDPEIVQNASLLVLSTLQLSGQQRPCELQERMGLSRGGITKVLDRLESRGFVRRDRDRIPEDRRAVVVSLTHEGEDLLRGLARELSRRLPETRALVEAIVETLG